MIFVFNLVLIVLYFSSNSVVWIILVFPLFKVHICLYITSSIKESSIFLFLHLIVPLLQHCSFWQLYDKLSRAVCPHSLLSLSLDLNVRRKHYFTFNTLLNNFLTKEVVKFAKTQEVKATIRKIKRNDSAQMSGLRFLLSAATDYKIFNYAK